MIERIAKALEIESYFLFVPKGFNTHEPDHSLRGGASGRGMLIKNEPIGPSAPHLPVKLAPSQKRKILDRVNSAFSKILDDF
jgi:hypothetical protein